MITSKRQLNKKGYSGLAFILLIIAMCFTAFVALPFCETQASAAYVYNKASFEAINREVTNAGGTYWHHVDLDNGGGVLFSNDDASGKAHINSGKHVDKNNFPTTSLESLQFAPGYYDLSTINDTSLGSKLGFDSFDSTRKLEISLNNLNQNFGVGTGYFGYNSNDDGMSVSTTLSADRLEYKVDAHTKGTEGTARSKAWKIDNGLMYTYISVPADLAKFLSVSVSANVATVNNITAYTHKNSGPEAYSTNCKTMPFIEIQIGDKPNTDPQDLNFNVGEIGDTSSKTKLYSQVTGNGSDSENESLTRKTGEVFMNGNTWIKVLVGVMANDSNDIYKGNASTRLQSWSNYLNLSNVKLQFKLTLPEINQKIVSTSGSQYISWERTVSVQIAFDKKILAVNGANYTDLSNTNNLFVYRLTNLKNNEVIELKTGVANATLTPLLNKQGEPVVIENRDIYELNFNIAKNGIYKFGIYTKSGLLIQENSTVDNYTENKIDTNKPSKPNSSLPAIENPDPQTQSELLNLMWINDVKSKFTISDFIDPVGINDNLEGKYSEVKSSGVKKLNVYFRRVNGDADTIKGDFKKYATEPGTYFKEININSNIDQKLNPINFSYKLGEQIKTIDTFFNYKDPTAQEAIDMNLGYGTYIVFYKVIDGVDLSSDYGCSFFKYESVDPIAPNNIQLYTDPTQDNWLTSVQFNSKWMNQQYLTIKFGLKNTYFFPELISFVLNDSENNEIAKFNYTNEQKEITFDGTDSSSGSKKIIIEANTYYAVVNLSEPPFKKDAVLKDTLTIKFVKSGLSGQFTNTLDLKFDNKKPFEGNTNPFFDIENNQQLIAQNKWYTFKDNVVVLNKLKNEGIKVTQHNNGGMYFFVNANDENVTLDLLEKYTFKVNLKNGLEVVQPTIYYLVDKNGFVLFIDKKYLVKDNFTDGKTEIMVYDQANNEGVIEIPAIQYDDQIYKIGSMNLTHLVSLYNSFIKISENVLDLSTMQKGTTELNNDNLTAITNREYARGESIIIEERNPQDTNSKYRYDGFTCNGDIYTKELVFDGSLANPSALVINILITKFVEINAYVEGNDVPLTNDNSTPNIEYNGKEIQLVIKDKENYVHDSGIIVKNNELVKYNNETKKWSNIKNVKDGGIIVTLSIFNENDRIETKNDLTVKINIVPKEVQYRLNVDSNYIANDTIQQIYANKTEIKGSILGLLDSANTIALKFNAIDKDLKIKEFNDLSASPDLYTVNIVTAITNGIDNFNNYKFVFYNDTTRIENLKIKVVPREVKVVFSNIPDNTSQKPYIFGDEIRDVSQIKMVMDGESLKTNFGPSLLALPISGNPTLYEDKQLTKPVTYLTDANDEVNPYYYIGVDSLYVVGDNNNYKLIVDNVTNKFKIYKKDLTITLASNSFVYGSVPDFSQYSSLKFDGLVAGNDENILTIEQVYVLKGDAVTDPAPQKGIDKNVYGFYNVGSYKAYYITNKDSIKNYNINFDIVQKFNVVQKEIVFGINNSAAIYGKVYDGIALTKIGNKYLIDEKPLFPIDIEYIKSQFINKAEFDSYEELLNSSNAFTFYGTPDPTVDLLDVKKEGYSLAIDASFDSLVNDANKNYKLIPNEKSIVNLKFEIIPLSIDAQIASFTYKGSPDQLITNFNELVRYYGKGFTKGEIAGFNLPDNITDIVRDKNKFDTQIINIKTGAVLNDINSLTAAAGRYSIQIVYTGDYDNYIINQNYLTLDILTQLYNLRNDVLRKAVKDVTDTFVYTGKNILTEENNTIVIKVNETLYIKAKLYTKDRCVNVLNGTFYNIYVAKNSFELYKNLDCTESNNNYSGVEISGGEIPNNKFEFNIKPKEIVDGDIPKDISMVYNGTTNCKVTVKLNESNLDVTLTGTLNDATAESLNNKNISLILDKNYVIGSLTTITRDVTVTKRDATISYIGSNYKEENSTFNLSDFEFNNVLESDKKYIKFKIAKDHTDLTDLKVIDTTLDSITYNGQPIIFVLDNPNYNVNYNVNVVKITLNILTKDDNVDIEMTSASSKIYDNTGLELTFNLTPTEIKINGVKTNNPVLKDAGIYTVEVTTNKGKKTFIVTIKQREIDVTSEINPNKEFDNNTDADLSFKNGFKIFTYNKCGENVDVEIITNPNTKYVNLLGGDSYIDYKLVLHSSETGPIANVDNYKLKNDTGTILGTITKKKGLRLYLNNTVTYGETLGFEKPIDNQYNKDNILVIDDPTKPIGGEGYFVNPNIIADVTFSTSDVGQVNVTFNFTSPYYEIDVYKKGEVNPISGNTITIERTRRDVTISSPMNLKYPVETSLNDIRIVAEIEKKNKGVTGYIEKDTALFRAIEDKLYTIDATDISSVGEYNIIKKVFTPGTEFNNYNLVIEDVFEGKHHVITIEGKKVKVVINGLDKHFIYSNKVNADGSNIDLNVIKNEILSNVKLFDNKNFEITLKDNEKNNIDIAISHDFNNNNPILIDNYYELNVGTYYISISYKEGTAKDKQNYIFESYAVSNIKVIIDKKPIKLEFKNDAFKYNIAKGQYEIISTYGDQHLDTGIKFDKTILSNILIAKDMSLNSNEPLDMNKFVFYLKRNNILATENGELVEFNNVSEYNADIYNINLDSVYISNKTSGQEVDINNYDIQIPTDINKYKVNILPKELKPYLKVSDKDPVYKYLSELPELVPTNKNLNIIFKGLIEGDIVTGAIADIKREEGETVKLVNDKLDGYQIYVKFVGINNKNYYVTTDKFGYATTSNKLIIEPREINIKSFNFDNTKIYDTTNIGLNQKIDLEFYDLLNNPIDKNKIKDNKLIINNKVIGINELVIINAIFNSSNVKDATTITFTLDLLDKVNFKIICDSIITPYENGELNHNGIHFDYTTKGSITPYNYEIEILDFENKAIEFNKANPDFKKPVSKVYDGNTNFYSDNKTIELNNNSINIDLSGNFKSQYVGENNFFVLKVIFTTNLDNFTTNFKFIINKTLTIYDTDIVNKTFVKDDKPAMINPKKLVEKEDKLEIHNYKIYDDDDTTNIYYDESKLTDKQKLDAADGKFVYDQDGYKSVIDIIIDGIVPGDENDIKVIFDLKTIKLGSDKLDAKTYEVFVNASIKESTLKNNYTIDEKLPIKFEIRQREVLIKVKPDFKSTITKVYDGDVNIQVNQLLNESDYDIIGILPKHRLNNLKVNLDGNAEFESFYAGQGIGIIIDGASVVDQNGNEDNNYVIANGGRVDGLTGNILPRDVYIDENKVIIYNTRYYGPERENYDVIVINNKNDGGVKDRTVSVYMPFKQSTATTGLLDQDTDPKFKLRADIPMWFSDDKISLRQDVQLQIKPNAEIKIVSDAEQDSEAKLIARSYKIGNLSTIFNGDILNVGINATGEEAYKHKVHIQKFVIKDEHIYFDDSNNIFDKVYDGNTNLNTRVVAKVGIFANINGVKTDLAPFLTKQIKGIKILNRENVYSDGPNVGPHKISLDLDTDNLAMNTGQSIYKDWYDLSQLSATINKTNGNDIISNIEPRVINVVVTTYDKVYDGVRGAILGVNYTYEVPTATTGKLEGVMPRDAKHISIIPINAVYDTLGVGNTKLTITGFDFDPNIGDKEVHDNYVIRIRYEGPNGVEQTVSRKFDVKITPKDLYVTPDNLVIDYSCGLPTIDELASLMKKPIVKGLIPGDLENVDYNNSIRYAYADGYKPGLLLDSRSYDAIKIVSSMKQNYHNYNVIEQLGSLIIKPLRITVKLNGNKPNMSYNPLEGFYSNIVNNVESAYEIYKTIGEGDQEKTVQISNIQELNAVKNYFRVTGIPDNSTDVGDHQLILKINKYSGYKNYSFNEEEFNNLKYMFKVKPIDVPYWNIIENQDFTFEFDTNKDFNQIIIDSVFTKDNTAYNIVKKSLVEISYDNAGNIVEGNEYPLMNKVTSDLPYKNIAVKLQAMKYNDAETGQNKFTLDDNNYNITYIPINSVTIVNKIINLAMRDSIDNVYNGKTQNYSNNYAGIPSMYKDLITIKFVNKDGFVSDTVSEVGEYIVLAYSNNNDYIVKSINSFKVSSDTVKDPDVVEKCKGDNYASAKFVINKIVIRNIGKDNIQTLPIENVSDYLVDLLDKIIINNDAIDKNNNIELTTNSTKMTDAGLYNVTINLLDETKDKNGLQISNYILDNPLIIIQVVTNKITDNKNVTISTKDGSTIRQDLVDAKLVYFEGNDQDKSNMLKAQNSIFGKIHQLVYAQFKVDGKNVTVDSQSVYLNGKVNIEIKLDPNFKDKDLYLVTDDGSIKQITNDMITYKTNEFGEACASFDTDELGWFVYADAPVSKQVRNATITYAVLGCVIGVLVIAFLVLCIRAYKLKKLTK